jgi:hypothetical protein
MATTCQPTPAISARLTAPRRTVPRACSISLSATTPDAAAIGGMTNRKWRMQSYVTGRLITKYANGKAMAVKSTT